MAFSFVQYTADGTATTFAIPFAYLAADHISVTVNGVAATFTFPTQASVQITPTPVSGAAVEVRRTTPVDTRVTDFSDGSTLGEADLDNIVSQLLYITQEARDSLTNQINLVGSSWDAQSRKIINVTPGAANGEAVAYEQIVGVVDATTAARDAALAAQTGAEAARDAAVAAAPEVGRVLVSANDTTNRFLDDALDVAAELQTTVQNEGADETMTIGLGNGALAALRLTRALNFT